MNKNIKYLKIFHYLLQNEVLPARRGTRKWWDLPPAAFGGLWAENKPGTNTYSHEPPSSGQPEETFTLNTDNTVCKIG